jgi:thiamine biosynthesis lipoprotein
MKKNSLFLLTLILCTSCRQQAVYYEESGSVFHTLYQIKYQSAQLLSGEIDAELQAFNLSLNPFNPHSIVAKVNRNEEVEVDEWFRTVFNKAMEVSEHSGGMFDVTAAPFINLWGFGYEQRSDSVSQSLIDSLKTFVGYRKIHLNGSRVVKDDPRLQLNFSAIAKGYACDVIAALMERNGVENYMVEIGGEITAKGLNPNGECWRAGINKPDEKAAANHEINEILRLCRKCGMATSGNYRNYYLKDGKKYAHTINPHTGYPSEQTILSATIIAPDCMTADAYATAFMAMGAEAACAMAAQIPDIDYYLILSDDGASSYQIRYSEGIKPMLVSAK